MSCLVLAESFVLVEESMGVVCWQTEVNKTTLGVVHMAMRYTAPFFGLTLLLEKGESMKDVNGL